MSDRLITSLSEKASKIGIGIGIGIGSAITVVQLCRVLGVSHQGYSGSCQRTQVAPEVCAAGLS